jgi:ferredoxin-NADP reductase/Na+-translocating ferredoxin:NAD+ oxidoreductase RnfD subunit
MLRILDDTLNGVTMYRLLLYGLGALLFSAAAFASLDLLPFTLIDLVVSVGVSLGVCWTVNILLSSLYRLPHNQESSLITALILCCIFTPSMAPGSLATLSLAGIIAMASKYLVTVHGKHIFNPVAFSAVCVGLAGLTFPTWWIGSSIMLPFTLLGGFLIVRKIRKVSMVASFLGVALAVIAALSIFDGRLVTEAVKEGVASAPMIFFAAVMLTEPFTSPSRKKWRVVFGILVGFLFASRWHVGPFYSTPELALVLGNVFAFAVGSRQNTVLRLKKKIQISPAVYDFVFSSDKKLEFLPGQYMEWTLPGVKLDGRGNRRSFTIASSPTESEIHLGVKFYQPSSTFKLRLQRMKEGEVLLAGNVSGDFTLPANTAEKLLFVAGGIGITPFRSMLKNLIDTGEKRDIVLLYSVSDPEEVAYSGIFETATRFGIRIEVFVSDEVKAKGWKGQKGFITEEAIRQHVPDYQGRTTYLSGPSSFVDRYRSLLFRMGVARSHVKTDHFSGY